MIFSEEEKDVETDKIEFITSLSKEESCVVNIKDEKSTKQLQPNLQQKQLKSMKDSKVYASRSTENEKKKPLVKNNWGLQVPERKMKNIENKETSSGVPLLLKNRLFGLPEFNNENEKFSKDLDSRPMEPTKESYSKIGVEEFGAAMLRGMGWNGSVDQDSKESKNSSNPSNTCNVIKYVSRPERLGLGASKVTDVSELKQRKPVEQALGIEMSKDDEKKLFGNRASKRKTIEIPQSNTIGIDEIVPKRLKIDIEIGTRVIIVEGEHSGLKGFVKGNRDDRFWLVELEINGRDILLLKSQVKRYDPKSNYSIASTSQFSNENQLLWACPGLKVKIKSKTFENGKFYNRKGIILDVQPDRTCTIKLINDSSMIVQAVPQRTLETCLPRDINSSHPTVKYLKKDRGEEHFQAPFRVLQFEDEKGKAVIQAEDDFEVIFEAHYDDICEFVICYN